MLDATPKNICDQSNRSWSFGYLTLLIMIVNDQKCITMLLDNFAIQKTGCLNLYVFMTSNEVLQELLDAYASLDYCPPMKAL